MKCAWNEMLAILPPWISSEADKQGREDLQELRLRLGKPPELVTGNGTAQLKRKVNREDLNFCINTASKYSPWAAQTIAEGYITAPGGHRIGICGDVVVKNGLVSGIRDVRMLCIRVARDFPGIGKRAAEIKGSILMIGPPGSGKTTLLRDIVRQISMTDPVAVVDERRELFPVEGCFDQGRHLDVLHGCPKAQGIDMVLRTMGPNCIAVDEITAEADCDELIRAGWCGVRLLATAHGATLKDLQSRPVYRNMLSKSLFDHVIILRRDKTWHTERMTL